jgi:hypothetical protein
MKETRKIMARKRGEVLKDVEGYCAAWWGLSPTAEGGYTEYGATLCTLISHEDTAIGAHTWSRRQSACAVGRPVCDTVQAGAFDRPFRLSVYADSLCTVLYMQPLSFVDIDCCVCVCVCVWGGGGRTTLVNRSPSPAPSSMILAYVDSDIL